MAENVPGWRGMIQYVPVWPGMAEITTTVTMQLSFFSRQCELDHQAGFDLDVTGSCSISSEPFTGAARIQGTYRAGHQRILR